MRPGAALLLVGLLAAAAALGRGTPRGSEGWSGLLVGSFRGPLAGLTWLEADLAFRRGRYGEVARLLRRLTRLNPASPAVWDVAAWHLAYNAARREPDAAVRRRLLWEAYLLLREGRRRLPAARRLGRALVRLCLERLRAEGAALFRRLTGRWPEEEAHAVARILLRGGRGEDGLLALAAAEAAGGRALRDGRGEAAAAAFREAASVAEGLARRFAGDPTWRAALARTAGEVRAWQAVARLELAAERLQNSGRFAEARARRRAALVRLATLEALLPEDRREDAAAVRLALRRRLERGDLPADR